jgi:hypothetical protein
MSDELVFTVQGSKAHAAQPVTLPEIGLTERGDLQEWVLEHPNILGENVIVVTFEFDRWWSSSGTPLDRLDVLGLDTDGRLVVAELKRDVAPDTVEMQAIKYAAMVSRFTPESVASQHAKFLSTRSEPVTEEQALALLEAHTTQAELSVESLRNPRIVLLAASFPPVVTATAVWLREIGLDITLMRFQAYKTELQTLVTVSQLLPLRDVEEFTVVPRTAARSSAADELPWMEWTLADYVKLNDVTANPTIFTLLNLCSSHPGTPVPLDDAVEASGRIRTVVRADLAGLTVIVKRRFGRSNWPFTTDWAAGGDPQQYYRMSVEEAAVWREAAASMGLIHTGGAPQLVTHPE